MTRKTYKSQTFDILLKTYGTEGRFGVREIQKVYEDVSGMKQATYLPRRLYGCGRGFGEWTHATRNDRRYLIHHEADRKFSIAIAPTK